MGPEPDAAVVARAKRNFRARNTRLDRAWDLDDLKGRPGALVLTDAERAEFLAQARHEMARDKKSIRPFALQAARIGAGPGGFQVQENRPA